MIYYFAYGSNLHPIRLMERAPSAELVGVSQHPGYKLTFHKQSDDGSGKCNMYRASAAPDQILGAVYRLLPEHKNDLDIFEGNGYIDNQISISLSGTEYTCFTYLAQQSHIVDNLLPYEWYKRLVILGAQYLKFPQSYVSAIEAIASIDDPDIERAKEKQMLIDRILYYR